MRSIEPKVVFSPQYDLHFFGLERVHPFDGRKFGRAWRELALSFPELRRWTLAPEAPVSEADLLAVHTAAYVRKDLQSPTYVAGALEIPLLRLIGSRLLDTRVLTPMRWATMGTCLAAEYALTGSIAINLGGGFHHASQDRGEGFCIFADIAVAVARLRRMGKLTPEDKLLIVDVDAHQGNGNERVFYDNPSVSILDMYNKDIYPGDRWARRRIDYDIPVPSGIRDEEYLRALDSNLSRALSELGSISLAFVIAGTDVYEGDQLGRLQLSADGVLARDKLVFHRLVEANVPWVMLLGGGYSKESYHLVAQSVGYALRTWRPIAERSIPR